MKKKKKRPNKLYREGVQVMAWVDEAAHAALKEHGVNVSEVIREAIESAAKALKRRPS